MAAAAEGHKGIAGAGQLRDWADKPLRCLSIGCCRLPLSCVLISMLGQMHSEDVPEL